MNKIIIVLLCLLLCFNHSVKAQTVIKNINSQSKSPNLIQFGQLKQDEIYTPNNLTEKIKNSSHSVTVYDREKLDMLNPVTLSDVINLTPGISVNSYGSPGNLTTFRIRGWNKSLMTLDGIRINNEDFNQPYLNPYGADGFERIEIIRGPMGTTQGTQTQGGVLALFTKQGYGLPKIGYNQGFGNNLTFKEQFEFEGGNPSYDYYLNVTKYNTNGGSPTLTDGRSKNDGYGNFLVTSNLGKRLFKNTAEVRNTFRFINSTKEVGVNSNGWPEYDPNHKAYRLNIFDSFLFNQKPVDFYDYNVKFGLLKSIYKNIDEYDIEDGPVAFWSRYWKTDNLRLMFSTQHNLNIKDINTFSVGYQLEYNDFKTIDNIGTEFNKDITKNDVYFNDVLNIKDILFIKAGTRITDSNIYGTYATPNVSGSLILPTFNIPDSTTKIKSSYGYSLSEPTALQLFNPMWGNSNLSPEKLKGWDVGGEQSFLNDKITLGATFFDNRIKDLIMFDMSTWTYDNIAKAKTHGIESEITLKPIKNVYATVNYTYTKGREVDTLTNKYKELRYTPRNRWNFLLSYEFKPDYNIYTRASVASSSKGLTEKIDGYFDLGLGTNIKLYQKNGFKVSFWGQLANILNKKYQQIQRYRHPGIHFLAGLKITKAI